MAKSRSDCGQVAVFGSVTAELRLKPFGGTNAVSGSKRISLYRTEMTLRLRWFMRTYTARRGIVQTRGTGTVFTGRAVFRGTLEEEWEALVREFCGEEWR